MSTNESSADSPAHPAPAAEQPVEGRRRVMGLLDITLFTVSAMLVIDQLTASASIGTKTIGWWLLCIVIFLIPYGLITSELATAYPEQGGIYVWVKRAFGRRWGTRTTYWYWVNVALWMPSVFLLFAGVFSQLFVHSWSDWSSGKWYQVGISIALSWLVVGVGIMRLEIGKWVNNIGAALKVAIILTIGIGGIVFAVRHGSANHINGSSFVPSFNVAKDFLPVIIYMLIGFELVSSMGGEIKKPEQQIPRAFFTSGVVTALLYVFATVGILLSLSLNKLSLVQGLVDTFKAILGTSGVGEAAVYVLGIGALYTYFTNMTTWTMGANRAVAEAASDGELPSFLAREDPKRGTPVIAFLVTGTISTIVLLIAAIFIKSQDSLYYAVFAASSVVFLLPYLLMFPAALALRIKEPDRPRPFRVPGGTRTLAALVGLTTLVIVATALLFIWPEIPHRPADWSYTGPLLGIVVGALVAGEALIWRGVHPRKTPRAAKPASTRAGGCQPAERRIVSETFDSTPAADGFHMPAEWEPHDGCWMVWPERPDNWRWGAKPAQAAFAAVAHAIAAGEQVTMAVSAAQYEHCRSVLAPEIRVVEMSSNDAWMRDIGPTFVIDGRGQRRGVDWRFNAWGGLEGGLYFPWDADDQVASKVLEIERTGRYRAPIVLEGGSIHVDGAGHGAGDRGMPAEPQPKSRA